MNKEFFEEQNESHYLILGKAVHVWADIEHSVFGYLKIFCGSEQAYKELMSCGFMNLSFKLGVLYCFVDLRIEKNTLTYKDDLEGVSTLFKEIKKLSNTRNKFIHNPIGYWLDDEEKYFVNGLLIGKKIGEHKEFSTYNLADIKIFICKAEKLHNDLKNIMSKMRIQCQL